MALYIKSDHISGVSMEYGVWSVYSFLRDLQEGKASPFHCNLIPFSDFQHFGPIFETSLSLPRGMEPLRLKVY